jgi:tetratricopeptide (TPR) repeat protein
MTHPRLYINHIAGLDRFIALEYGRVDDGQPPGSCRGVGESFGFIHDAPGGPVVGFKITDFSRFDAEAPAVAEIWEGPRFDAPLLGLSGVSAGEVAMAARALLVPANTLNRVYFEAAIDEQENAQRALELWLACLQAGDSTAHLGLGYTLYELGRSHESYRHLRRYTEIAPYGAWNWCWLGKVAEQLGEYAEARRAYRRAIDLEATGADETDARERLTALWGSGVIDAEDMS